MADIPVTHYVKSDDVHIAYQVIGDGPRDLLFVPGFVSNVEALWQSPARTSFFRRLATFARVILFDKRGTGMSDRGSQIFTLEQRMHDVQAVLDQVGSRRATLFGVSEGGPMSLLYAATYPERTSALVLCGTYARRSWAPNYIFAWTDAQWSAFLDDVEHHWGTADAMSLLMWAPSLAGNRQALEQIAAYFRASASPGAASAVMRMNREIDVREILPVTRVPTLILHRTDDRVIDVRHARYMAQRIPRAKLIELSGQDHVAWVGNQNALLDEVEEFVTGQRHAAEPDRVLATVLFVDIAGSTERAAALGDRAWRALLDSFYAKVRGVLGQHRGRESTPLATVSWPPSTGPRALCAAPAQLARRCARSIFGSVAVCIPASASLSLRTLLALPYILARVWRRWLPRVKFWSHRRFATSWQALD